jgi:predicted nuclease of predicted toxin-antitoxin system
MKIIIDECLPVDIKKLFNDYEIYTIRDLNWTGLKNGQLLEKIVENNFDIFLTVDKKLRFQQNLKGIKLSFIILDIIRNKTEEVIQIKQLIIEAFNTIKQSEVYIVSFKEGISKLK